MVKGVIQKYITRPGMESVMKTARGLALSAKEAAAVNCGFAVFAIRRMHRAIRERSTMTLGTEAGELATWVVMTAILVVAAIAIVGVVVSSLNNSANNISNHVNTAPIP
jgi:hypothetical protein